MFGRFWGTLPSRNLVYRAKFTQGCAGERASACCDSSLAPLVSRPGRKSPKLSESTTDITADTNSVRISRLPPITHFPWWPEDTLQHSGGKERQDEDSGTTTSVCSRIGR